MKKKLKSLVDLDKENNKKEIENINSKNEEIEINDLLEPEQTKMKISNNEEKKVNVSVNTLLVNVSKKTKEKDNQRIQIYISAKLKSKIQEKSNGRKINIFLKDILIEMFDK